MGGRDVRLRGQRSHLERLVDVLLHISNAALHFLPGPAVPVPETLWGHIRPRDTAAAGPEGWISPAANIAHLIRLYHN
jgi:hypothetical protein